MKPWARDKDSVLLDVWIHQDEQGRVYSQHRPQTAGDHQNLIAWKSGGLEQVAFAFLAESLKREAVRDLLLLESKEPGFLARIQAMDADGQQAIGKDLAAKICHLYKGAVLNMVEGALQDALKMIQD
jgi:hypothetical protein